MSRFWYGLRDYSIICAAILTIFDAAMVEKAWIWVNVATAAIIALAILCEYMAIKKAEEEERKEYIAHLEELEAMGQQADMELNRLKLFREYEGGKS